MGYCIKIRYTPSQICVPWDRNYAFHTVLVYRNMRKITNKKCTEICNGIPKLGKSPVGHVETATDIHTTDILQLIRASSTLVLISVSVFSPVDAMLCVKHGAIYIYICNTSGIKQDKVITLTASLIFHNYLNYPSGSCSVYRYQK